MIESIRIKVEGLPEEIQRIADALEVFFPGALSWLEEVKTSEGNFLTVSGVGMPWFAHAQGQHDGASFNSQDQKPLAELNYLSPSTACVCGHDLEGFRRRGCADLRCARFLHTERSVQNGPG